MFQINYRLEQSDANIIAYEFMQEELVNIMRKFKPVLDYNKFNAMLIVKAKNYWIAKHQK